MGHQSRSIRGHHSRVHARGLSCRLCSDDRRSLPCRPKYGLAVRRLAVFGSNSPADIAAQALQTGQTIGYSADDISTLQELTRALQAYQPAPTPIGAHRKTAHQQAVRLETLPMGGDSHRGCRIALGLLYAWMIAPVRYINTVPNTLRADFKDQYRVLIAASYSATHDLARAKSRLELLGDANPLQALTGQAQRMLASGQPFDVVRQVAILADDMQSGIAHIPPTAKNGIKYQCGDANFNAGRSFVRNWNAASFANRITYRPNHQYDPSIKNRNAAPNIHSHTDSRRAVLSC